MIRKLPLIACSICAVSIVSSIFALPSQPSFAASNSFSFLKQGDMLPDVFVNRQKQNKTLINVPKPGGDGQ
jgi:hypothetical protein